MQASQPLLNGLAKRLVNTGVIDSEAAKRALSESRAAQKSFISYLIEKRLISARRAAVAASDEFGLPILDLDSFMLDAIPKELIDSKLIAKHQVIPLIKRENRLYVGIADPSNIRALDELRFSTGIPTEAVIVEEDKLTRKIELLIDSQDDGTAALGDLADSDLDNLELGDTERRTEEDSVADATSDAPIVRFVNKVLLDAIKNGASDIHFEPYEKSYRVRCRIDCILQEVSNPPINLAARLSARLKVMSNMDIAERRVPQDGRIKLKVSAKRSIDFRVNTLPTLWGEKIVLRILDPTSATIGVDALGFEPEQRELFMSVLRRPQGMVLVTGPTGSGKTVTLYTGLNILNEEERNISTAEDPVEINMEGVNQVHVNPKVGLTFAEALRAFLRQDPDVVMVGEIRDLETAEIAIKAAQTGHMVLSTLHTNSAPETLTRLRNMGVASFNIATSVTLIIAQRLARRLCSSCKTQVDLPRATLLEEGFTEEQLDKLTIFEHNPDGCPRCNRGYRGRVGLYEMLKVSPEIAECIMNNGNAIEILKVAKSEGFATLRSAGLRKVAAGVTSLEEMNRVIKT